MESKTMTIDIGKISIDLNQQNILGHAAPIFHCVTKPASEQCIYMFGIEWLEHLNASVHKFFEYEALYDNQSKITIASLKRFGQLSACANYAMDWIEKETPCKKCLDCQRSENFRAYVLKSDYYQLLLYYESISKTLNSKRKNQL